MIGTECEECVTNCEALGQGLLELVEGLTEVVEEILGRLDAHREPHQIGGNFEFGPGRGGVGHHAGMLDQGLDGAERLGQRENLVVVVMRIAASAPPCTRNDTMPPNFFICRVAAAWPG